MTGRIRRFLVAFLAVMLLAGWSDAGWARSKVGGGIVVGGGGTTSNQNTQFSSSGYFSLGGQGVSYAGRFLRTGMDVAAMLSQTGGTIRGGFFGDFVFGHIANADIFAGLGVGYGGGTLFFNAGAMYLRPEFGVQWNLGRTAIDAKLYSLLVLPTGTTYYAMSYGGVSVSLLFGNFPVAGARRAPPPPRRKVPPPPRRYRRRPPPPPPPPRGY